MKIYHSISDGTSGTFVSVCKVFEPGPFTAYSERLPMRIVKDICLSSVLLTLLALFGCSEKKSESSAQAISINKEISTQTEETTKVVEHTSKQNDSETKLVKIEHSTAENPAAENKAAETAPKSEPAKQASNAATTPAKPSEHRPFTEGALLPRDAVGLVVAHPRQFFQSPVGTLLKEHGYQREIPNFKQFLEQTNLDPADIERFIVVFDQKTVNAIARQNGLQVADQGGGNQALENQILKNKLKQIGLAFHNYHDVYNKFPRVDGDGDGRRTGLSWRVHLLPFLDHAPLYNQFHLDEPWDSDHNKALIEQMPEIFKTPDVTEPNHTALQVLTGEKTAFHGDTGPGLRDVTDGTSNTLLCIKAGANKANIWTKPEGIEVDLNSPKEAFGEIEEKQTLVLFFDGLVTNLPLDLDDTTLSFLIQHADGNPVNFERQATQKPSEATSPTVILSMAVDINRDDLQRQVLTESAEETHEGQSFRANKTTAVWFVDDRTVVMGSIPTVKAAIESHQAKQTDALPITDELHLNSVLTFAFDLQSQAELLQQLLQINPMLGIVSNVKTLAGGVSADGKPNDALVELVATAIDAQMAGGLAGIATLGANQMKMSIQNLPLPPSANDGDKEMNGLIKKIAASATVTTEDDKVRLRVLIPEGFDRIPELLRPNLEQH